MLYSGPTRGPQRPLSPNEEAFRDVVVGACERADECLERTEFDQALFELDTVLTLMPDLQQVHWNKAHVLLSMGDTHWNKGHVLLSMGDHYIEGFKEFECRSQFFGDALADSGVPRWSGDDIAGKRLLLYHEYGYGDTLMMLRYVPVLKKMGADITLICPKSLARLARLQFQIEVLDEVPLTFDRWDYRCPMFSIMVALKQTVKDIPSAPYIIQPFRFGLFGDSRIGITWSGNPKHLRDKHRSIEIDTFLSLLNRNGHRLYSLQPDENGEARARGVLTPSLEDFTDTADWISALDHIVTVDTAAAHLAGAMGHPSVHLLLPYAQDWRWYNGAAWYPKIKMYRQPKPGDWASVFAKLNTSLWGGDVHDVH
jgi:hypothetical protein